MLPRGASPRLGSMLLASLWLRQGIACIASAGPADQRGSAVKTSTDMASCTIRGAGRWLPVFGHTVAPGNLEPASSSRMTAGRMSTDASFAARTIRCRALAENGGVIATDRASSDGRDGLSH